MTNLDQSGRERLEPRPVSRPPVDPASRRAFGRPDGVDGSFVGLDRYRDQGEYTPKDQAPDRVLAEAFGRHEAYEVPDEGPADVTIPEPPPAPVTQPAEAEDDASSEMPAPMPASPVSKL
ncbi:MAG: hypothetical protein QOK45_2385, partial [Mycobacterium sp.]|nr:hypothetical protein [Mycobacterium sp.]